MRGPTSAEGENARIVTAGSSTKTAKTASAA